MNTYNKDLIFIKLGGAAITHKSKPGKVNFSVLKRVSKEISGFYDDYKLLIGHGGGSFPHAVASKYDLSNGIETCGVRGFTEIQASAHALNNIVLEEFLKKKIPAISIQPSACTIMDNGKVKKMYYEPIETLLNNGIVPIIYGDIIPDRSKGCSIASTEMLFSYLARKLKPSKIIIGTDVDGVFTEDPKKGNGELIELIDKNNIQNILKNIKPTISNDVTGGMYHKVKELYKLSKLDIEIDIINLLKKDYLKETVKEKRLGTRILR